MKLKEGMKLRVNLGPATMRKGVRIVSVRAATPQAQRTPGDPGGCARGPAERANASTKTRSHVRPARVGEYSVLWSPLNSLRAAVSLL